MALKIVEADYSDEQHAEDILFLTDQYARDEMGLGETLPNYTKFNLVKELKKMPVAISFLAYKEGRAVGLAHCFISLSTFQARRMITIQDLAVLPEERGEGIGFEILTAVESKARELNCCKIILEVRQDNPARKLYKRFGFEKSSPPMIHMSKDIY
ncbi:MAG: GNAT family N-acetyltransferase [Balneolaceae bacterium]|nr:GNAT family N-acetyltransferase [Balneolaceae bacterium]